MLKDCFLSWFGDAAATKAAGTAMGADVEEVVVFEIGKTLIFLLFLLELNKH